METRNKFTSVAQLQEYAGARGGGWEPQTPTQTAYTRIYNLCARYNITLAEVKEGLAYMIEHATNATRKKVYSRIANSIAQGEWQYSLCFGPGEHDYASTPRIEILPSLIGDYIGVQSFSVLIVQDGEELDRGVYQCLDANSHWLRVVRETGQAVGLIEKLAVLVADNTWVLKAKRIDADQPSLAIHYYQWLMFFAVPATDAERAALQAEIRALDEQAEQLGLRFHLQNQDVLLDEVEEETGQ